jgi:tRNA(Ile)-lysidine synthase
VDEFSEKILKFIEENRLILRGEPIIVGVSGGVDSVVLLHVLNHISPIIDFKIVVAHFNHCLRGNESDEDERFVGELASKLNLPFRSGSGDVRLLKEKEKYSLEMAARRLRHEFLVSVAREFGSKKIALAHHSDDQVELFFLRLLRGAGPSGLRGMKPMAPSPVDHEITIIRPLLKITRSEIEKYAHENYLDYRIDSTNKDTYFLRNKIRNELIPLLKLEYQCSIENIVHRIIDILDTDEDFIREEAEKWTVQRNPEFTNLHPALQRKIIQMQLSAIGVEPEYSLIENLRNNLNKQVSAENDVMLILNNQGIIEILGHRNEFLPDQQKLSLNSDKGEVAFMDSKIRWEVIPSNFDERDQQVAEKINNIVKSKPSNVEYFDFEKVGNEIVLRHWKEGDRFKPIGMKSEVKLQDLFINLKIPRAYRHESIVAQTKDDKIFWVEGMRISEDFKLTPATKKILRWEIIRSINHNFKK